MKRFLPLLFLLLCGCTSRIATYTQNAGEIFHTTYHITYQSDKDWQTSIDSCLQCVDASLSMFNPHSTLSRINKAGTEPVDISDDSLACYLISRALEISALTDGAFDITVAPLVNLWGFGLQKSADVTPRQVDSIRSFVGYQKILFDGQCVTKADSRMKLDASAIAKGYACDVVAGLLESRGCQNYLVEIGGEIYMKGMNAKGEPWRVGVDKPVADPFAADRQLQIAIQLTDRGMATSGNYRNFYTKDGRRIAHTIDPFTGYPVEHSLLSATVLAPDCLTADALATSFMVMGLDKAKELSSMLPELLCYFIYSNQSGDFMTYGTPALTPYLRQL